MANQNDIDRLELGVSHWNAWADKLLDRKMALKKKRTWNIDKIGRAASTQTQDWVRDARVDFSGHKFESDVDFRGFIFPCVLMGQEHNIPSDVLASHKYTNFDDAEFKNAYFENTDISGTSFTGTKFEKADFTGTNLTYAKFENAVLFSASFRNADLSNTNFSGSTVEDADFSGAVIVGANFSKLKLKFTKFTSSKIEGCNFYKANLEDANFSDALTLSNCQYGVTILIGVSFPSNIVQMSFEGADLSNANLDNVSLVKCNFAGATLTGTSFIAADLSESDFRKVECSKATFTDATLTMAKFQNSVATNTSFENAKLDRTSFNSANLNFANFENANLEASNFRLAELNHANLANTELSGALFNPASLTSATMLGANFDKVTNFSNDPKVDDLKVDRYALECLENYGDLSVGARMKLDIHDDVATLRFEYSGYKQWIHLFAFAGFVFPYLWFILKQWGLASFISDPEVISIPLWKALLQFIYSGGNGWEQGWVFSVSFILFTIALVFNILKAVLMVKTKKLEFSQVASGLPAAFSLNDMVSDRLIELRWRHVFGAYRFGYYIYIIVVIFNLLHFFSMVIPIHK